MHLRCCICCRAEIWWESRQKLFEQNSMKSHLSQCFKKREFSLFPSTERKQIKSKNYLESLSIYCTCQKLFFKKDMEEDKRIFMIVCSKCGKWYHEKCEKILSQFFKDEKKHLFGNVLHVNDRLCFTFDIECKLFLDFY